MFKKIRARYVIQKFGKRKFPQIERKNINSEHIIDQFKSTPLVKKDTLVSSIGSCFAEEILKWLEDNKYNTQQPSWGMVYNPKNIKLIVKGALEYQSFNPKERFWDFGDGDIRTPYIKSSELAPYKLGSNLQEALKNEKELFSHFKQVFTNIEVLIITLGQTEYWASEKDYPFYAAPWGNVKDGNINHKIYNLTQQEIKSELEETITLLKTHNPNLKILISVSPVPLVASTLENYSAYIAAGWAKSSLHSATLEVVDTNENVYYMPSYEIVTSKPETTFKPDGRHVLRSTVNNIMDTFKKLYAK